MNYGMRCHEGNRRRGQKNGRRKAVPVPAQVQSLCGALALPARRPVSFLHRRTPALSGRPFCRAIFSLQTKRCGRSPPTRAFRTLRGGLCRLPDRRRAVWGSWTERGLVCRTIFRRRRGFRRAKAVECKMASGIDMLAAIGCAVVVLAVVTGVKYLCRRYGAGRRSPRGRA